METKFTEDDLLKVIIALETMGIYLSIPISGGTTNGKRITGFSTMSLLSSTLVKKKGKWYLRISTDDNGNIDTGPYDDVLVSCILKPFFDAVKKNSLTTPVTNKLSQFVQQQLKNDALCRELFAQYEGHYLKKRTAIVDGIYEDAAIARDAIKKIMVQIVDRLKIIIAEKKKQLDMDLFNEGMLSEAIPTSKLVAASKVNDPQKA